MAQAESIQNSPLRSLRGVRIHGTGSYAPTQVVRNEDLASLGFDADWIVQRTGIKERRHCPPGQATSDMAYEAAVRCLEDAQIDPEDVDLLLVGTFTPDLLAPSTACQVQHRLGLRAPALDVQAACAGFMYAMVTGMQYVRTGCSNHALIIGADCNSRICNPKDKKTYPLFGDGAGAVLLSPGSEQQGLLSYTLGSDGGGFELLCRPMGGSAMPSTIDGINDDLHYLKMDGRAVFKWAVRLVSESVRDVANEAGIEINDIDLLIMHQANIRIIDAVVSNLGIDKSKVFVNLDRYGNTSAASIPLALDEACQQNRVKQGDRIMLCGFGAGLSWGTCLLHW